MHEVICTHCGQDVHISPDAPRCSICGHDLHTLIPDHVAASYFYRRAADLAGRGDTASALAEAERGLGFVESSELRLLAAILSKRMGDLDTMRVHVAALPVDDRLRQEAEWLIRAQPSSRPDDMRARSGAVWSAEIEPEPDIEPTTPSPLEGTYNALPPVLPPEPIAAKSLSRSAVWTQRLWGLVALVLVVVAGAMGWALLSGGPDTLLALLPGMASPREETQPVGPLQPVTPIPLQLPTPTLQSAPSPSATVPADLVEAPASDALAAISPAPGIQTAAFDLDAILSGAGRDDLAALALNADLRGTTVRVSGVLTNTADRILIIDLAGAVAGVEEVNAVELLVRVPPTYTVRVGDSLWQIVERFYGSDATRVAEIFELNRDVLPSAQALQVGMVLRLPPID